MTGPSTLRQVLHGVLLSTLAALNVASAHEHAPARPEVAALLQRAETALAAGDSAQAQDAYEQAAALQHDAHIELGWVRARMQAGGYRQALAFAAHAAGAHPDEPDGALLYAHLLNAGGQAAAAEDVLARARRRLPDEPLLPPTLRACPGATPSPGAEALHLPPLGVAVPPGSRVAGSALLLGDARHAITAWALVADSAPPDSTADTPALWLRNGLGRTQRARVLSRDAQAGTALLQLDAPLDAPAELTRAPREAFPGSPALAVGYRAGAGAQPGWPQVCLGFLGGTPQPGEPRALGFGVDDASIGGPVFDTSGRLVGLVGPAGRASGASLLPAKQLAAFPAADTTAALPIDALYERALRSSLQLIRLPARNN